MPRIRNSTRKNLLAGTEPQTTTPDVSFIPAGRPPIPKDLKGTALFTFKRVCKILRRRNALTAGDGEAIRLYAIQFARHVRAYQHLEEEGEVVVATVLDKGGNQVERPRQNPWLRIAQDCEIKMAGFLDRLGLTGLNRDRVKPTTRAPRKNELPPDSAGALMQKLGLNSTGIPPAPSAEEAEPAIEPERNLNGEPQKYDRYTDFEA